MRGSGWMAKRDHCVFVRRVTNRIMRTALNSGSCKLSPERGGFVDRCKLSSRRWRNGSGVAPGNAKISSPRSMACSKEFDASAAADRIFSSSRRAPAGLSKRNFSFRRCKCAPVSGIRIGVTPSMNWFEQGALSDSEGASLKNAYAFLRHCEFGAAAQGRQKHLDASS